MVLSDDNPEKWVYKDHTHAKHEVLKKYIEPWVNKMTSYNKNSGTYNKIRVFDCFAGRGNYSDIENTEAYNLEYLDTPANIPGSPLLILDMLAYRKSQFEEADCILIEKNKENFEKLKEIISNTEEIPDKINIHLTNGKFQEEVLDMVEKTGGSDYPSLFFVDPFGFKSLNYDIITEIGSNRMSEMLITFMSDFMKRFMESPEHKKALNRVFGTQRIEELTEDFEPNNWEPIVEAYVERIKQGGPQNTFEYSIGYPDDEKTIYYLVFTSNSSAGIRTMRNVMSNCGTGNFRYAPQRPSTHREQQSLQATLGNKKGNIKKYLMEEFKGFRITFTEVMRKCSRDSRRKYRREREGDYREAIKELEQEGKVRVKRRSSKERGIQGKDLIHFLVKENN